MNNDAFWSHAFNFKKSELITFMNRISIDPNCFSAIIRFDNIELIELAVTKGADINQLDDDGFPPANHISDLGSTNGQLIFKWLVNNGADLNIGNEETPFTSAIMSTEPELIQLCLEYGAKVLNQNSSPLLRTIYSDPTGEIFKILFFAAKKELNNEKATINDLGIDSYQLLKIFAKSATPEFLDWAIAEGLNISGSTSSSPLEDACNRRNDPKGIVFKRLMEAGLPINQVKPEILSKFMLKVLDAGNSELFKLCVKQELTTTQRAHLLDSIKYNSKANQLYTEANTG